MTHIEICHPIADHTTAAARLIATAFAPLEVAEWLVPHPADRVRVLAAQSEIHVEDAFDRGSGSVLLGRYGPAAASGFHAAAVGYQPTEPLRPPADYEARLARACGPYLARFQRLDQAFDKRHPHDHPHHYLSYLATLPVHQSQGVGTELLRHVLDEVDRAGVPAYLIASNKDTSEFYERFGYEQWGGPLHLPDGPTMWPMRRGPRTATDSADSADGADGADPVVT